jgi:hypothetical protein
MKNSKSRGKQEVDVRYLFRKCERTDCLIEVTAGAGLTVYLLSVFYLIEVTAGAGLTVYLLSRKSLTNQILSFKIAWSTPDGRKFNS